MAIREVGQFSMVAFRENPEATEHMQAFRVVADEPGGFEAYGGLGNIQRVRVLQDGEKLSFAFVTKLPPALLAARKAEAARQAAKPAAKPQKAKPVRQAKPEKKPRPQLSKAQAFDRALAQDRRQRVEQAKALRKSGKLFTKSERAA